MGVAAEDATITATELRREIAILKDGRCVSCMEPVNPLHPKCACIRAEIEGYRQALEKAHRDRIAQSNGYSCGCWWDNKDDEAPGGVTLIVSPDCWLQRVLAGKEAQR